MKAVNCQTSLDAFQELSAKDDAALEEVLQRVDDRDFVALKFQAGVLTFSVDVDTDSIDVRFVDVETFDPAGLSDVSQTAPWSSFLGRTFGWGWVAVNQQGYQDGVLLSFGDIEPRVMLVAAASSLRIYEVRESV